MNIRILPNTCRSSLRRNAAVRRRRKWRTFSCRSGEKYACRCRNLLIFIYITKITKLFDNDYTVCYG